MPADARRAEIVEGAARLFDEYGYHQTTMDDIAAAVGVRKPTLYHYFRSKDEILFWIHEEVIDQIVDRHLRRLETHMPASQGLLEMIADILELMETRPGHSRVFFEHFRELPEEHQEVVREKRRRYSEMMENLIQQGVDAGEFRDVNPRLTMLAVSGMCNWAYQWLRPKDPMRSREVAYAFWDLVTRGVAPREANTDTEET